MTEPTPDLPIRFCPVCKTADDHPRHDIFGTDPNVVPHMDCCATVGCPDGSCNIAIREKGTKKGNSFRAQLTDKAFAKATKDLLDKRDDATRNFTHDDLDRSVHGAIIQSYITLQPVTGGNQ